MLMMTRRTFLDMTATGLGASLCLPAAVRASLPSQRAEAKAWFRQAKYGLFVHYGLVSLFPYGKTRPFPPADTTYGLWQRRFTAERFDANAIASLAREAGMKYVNFTPYHGGGPYLFQSTAGRPNTADDLPPRRDLVAEMAEACRRYDLKLMLYVHHTLSRSDAANYDRNMSLFEELLTQYGPIAGLWFDSDRLVHRHPERYPRLVELYTHVRRLQPACLISFCYGITGEEDFITFEHRLRDHAASPFLSDEVKRKLAGKPIEICSTLQLNEQGGSGIRMWFHVEGAYHRTADEVWHLLGETRRGQSNLLLNTGPRGDGSLHPADVLTLREVGRRLHEHGFPVARHDGPMQDDQPERVGWGDRDLCARARRFAGGSPGDLRH